ncbi:MAG: hypothetical protein U0Y68_12265 [Blastocatellia bacterium]
MRTIEKIDIGFPDGKFGKVSLSHVRRWQENNLKADWATFSATNPSPEYQQWMTLLQAAHVTVTDRHGSDDENQHGGP